MEQNCCHILVLKCLILSVNVFQIWKENMWKVFTCYPTENMTTLSLFGKQTKPR